MATAYQFIEYLILYNVKNVKEQIKILKDNNLQGIINPLKYLVAQWSSVAPLKEGISLRRQRKQKCNITFLLNLWVYSPNLQTRVIYLCTNITISGGLRFLNV